MKNSRISRRDVLRLAAVTPLAGAVTARSEAQVPGKTRVILIRDKNALDEAGNHRQEVIEEMLDEAVATLFATKDASSAWKKIIKTTDTVGIKTNSWNYLPTGKAVESALKQRIMDAGVSGDRIGIDDKDVLRNPLFQNASVLINARPARTHYWAGMGGCIKNLIMFTPTPSAYHGDSCADLATLWDLPPVKNKVKLNILLVLTPLFHGIGPHHYSKEYVWPYRGILVSQDPVAVDSVGVRILQAKRLQYFGEEKPLQPPAHHIAYAESRHHLGVAGPDKIELIKLGWQEDILI
jgi:hypothetical protein